MSRKLTQLESDILNWFSNYLQVSIFDNQLNHCEVSDREITPSGFFTHLKMTAEVDRFRARSWVSDVGLQINSPELENGAAVILFVEGGIIDCIEVWSHGDENPSDVTTYELTEVPMNRVSDN